ncbi:MAG: hypothetical protein EOM12_15240 [Verrucomicrobiae bacterium]|nr:hypothetical protein [Verrucomicrobiae bacterium]
MNKPYTIIELEQGTMEWLGWRHRGIGASDAPTVMGENPWKSSARLLQEKRSRVRQTRPNAAMQRGTLLEPKARVAYECETGSHVHPVCLQSSQYSWMRASLDGLSGDGKTIVEIKCGKSAYKSADISGEVPSYYYGQLQHILAVTGNDWIDFWAWWPKCKPVLIPVPRDERYITKLIEAEQIFWEQVAKGYPRKRSPKAEKQAAVKDKGKSIMHDEWIILDTETDGLYEPIHVIEIAAQKMKGWEPCGAPFQIFLNHNIDIPPEAVAVHGYTRNFLKKNGIDPMTAHERFRAYAGNLPLVAHNLGYDWNRALFPEWKRLCLQPIGQRGFCTMTLSRRTIDNVANYKLDTLRTHYRLKTGRSHHAANDVDAVVQLFLKVLGPKLEPLNFNNIDELIKFSKKNPVAKCLSEVNSGCRTQAITPKNKLQDAWYVLTDENQSHGPHTAAILHDMAGKEPCYVWREGMDDWAISIELDEFMKLAEKKPRKKSAKRIHKLSNKMLELMGVCRGIMADGVVSPEEVVYLDQWLQNAGCIDEWPASDLAATVERVLEDGVVTEVEQEEMADLIRRIEADERVTS